MLTLFFTVGAILTVAPLWCADGRKGRPYRKQQIISTIFHFMEVSYQNRRGNYPPPVLH